MQDLRIILIILGAVAIAALLIHGLWTSQKDRQKTMREKPIGKVPGRVATNASAEFAEFDSDGIGRVRVAGNRHAAPSPRAHEMEEEDDWQITPHFSAMSDDDADEPSLGLPPTLSSSLFAEDTVGVPNPYHDDEVTAQVSSPAHSRAEPGRTAQSRPQPDRVQNLSETQAEQLARQYRQGDIDPLFDSPGFAAKETTTAATARKEFAQPVASRPAPQAVKPAEPVSAPAEPALAETVKSEPVAPAEPAPVRRPLRQVPKTWQDVYVINVVARPNQQLTGMELIRALTDANFVFGDMDIFHRYQGANTQGDALFSLINMVNPGTFNPNAMAEFSTPGVSIFMQLPKPGMAKNDFNLMVQTAENIAEDLDAILLDGQRRPLSAEYLSRSREQLRDYDSQAQ